MPSDNDNHEPLRAKASKQLHGPGANPSLLGDPISLKAEASGRVPTEDEQGAAASSSSSSPNSGKGGKKGGGETLREKAAKKLNGPDANPSMLGDPVSLKAEQSSTVPVEREEGARRGSKL